MLQETEETIIFFCDIFIIVAFQLRGGGAPPSPATPMVLNAIRFLSSPIANMATILSNFQQKFALGRSFQHFAIEFLGTKKHYSHA